MSLVYLSIFLSFFNDPATTDIYTLSLHDALPISLKALPPSVNQYECSIATPRSNCCCTAGLQDVGKFTLPSFSAPAGGDRKSTRLNSSHSSISYAVFCLKKKKKAEKKPVLHSVKK